MINSILFHPVIVVPCAICIFLPWNVFLRVALCAGFISLFPLLLFLAAPSDGDPVKVFFLRTIFALAVLVPASIVQLLARRLIFGRWPAFQRYKYDFVFYWSMGIHTALIIFLWMAYLLAGTAQALLVHIAIAAVAVTFALMRRNIIALGTIIAMMLSLTYPMTVTNSAKAVADGVPYCIYLNQRHAFANGWQDLTFLTMDKGDFYPHAYVIIETAPPRYAYWSYQKRAFDTTWRYDYADTTLTCPTD